MKLNKYDVKKKEFDVQDENEEIQEEYQDYIDPEYDFLDQTQARPELMMTQFPENLTQNHSKLKLFYFE